MYSSIWLVRGGVCHINRPICEDVEEGRQTEAELARERDEDGESLKLPDCFYYCMYNNIIYSDNVTDVYKIFSYRKTECVFFYCFNKTFNYNDFLTGQCFLSCSGMFFLFVCFLMQRYTRRKNDTSPKMLILKDDSF